MKSNWDFEFRLDIEADTKAEAVTLLQEVFDKIKDGAYAGEADYSMGTYKYLMQPQVDEQEAELVEIEFGGEVTFADLEDGSGFVEVISAGTLGITAFEKIAPSINLATGSVVNAMSKNFEGPTAAGMFFQSSTLVVEIIVKENNEQ